jgi:nicotinamidase/pyrazinamidase
VSLFDGSTALVVVDLQNDFADPSGSLYVPGGEAILEYINDRIVAARRAGALVACTQDWHPAHTPHFAQDGGTWPVHCVMDTWGAALHPELVIAGPIVLKGSGGQDGYSGFAMRDPVSGVTASTELEGLLRGRGIRRVVVCGLATDYCVAATAIDAASLGFETSVLLDGVRAVELQPGDGARALDRMAAAGVALVGALGQDGPDRGGSAVARDAGPR